MTSPRRIGLVGAVGIGVGSMLGAGVFSDMWADVLAAGEWYLAAVLLAAVVALANALSTAQLAAAHPVAGGAYAYGRLELSRGWGLLAGAAFVIGKTVSVAVGALVLGAYVLPGHTQGVATAAIVLAWALNARGITRTAAGATVIAVIVVAALAVLLVLAATTASDGFGWFAYASLEPGAASDPSPAGWAPPFLVAAAAVFFAFAGYARVATLGEEVRDPARTIPRAIVMALGVVVVLYLAIAQAMHVFFSAPDPAPGTDASLTSAAPPLADAPLEGLAEAVGMAPWVMTAAAALSVGGAMLAVMAGAGRTAMAMAREGDLPRGLARQGATGAPWRAEAAIALCAVALVWSRGTDLILVSVAAILTYYAVANVAAIRQRLAGTTATLAVPVAVSAFGLIGCVVLAAVAAPAAAGSAWALAIIVVAVIGWPAIATAVRRRRSRGEQQAGPTE
ncbi:APC family permease [Demequina sp. NBRC 110056]|uniref:APC family permease n=1 Tax=Demequina sp. NBRC 110056 TaxID=1570345 RepID=UPI00117FDC24|nr:APC family permease [Demequina sp. NBRC 110056]